MISAGGLFTLDASKPIWMWLILIGSARALWRGIGDGRTQRCDEFLQSRLSGADWWGCDSKAQRGIRVFSPCRGGVKERDGAWCENAEASGRCRGR